MTRETEALIERLEKATGPDRDLDAALHVALLKPDQRPDDLRYYYLPHVSTDHMDMCAPGTYWLKERSGRSLHTAPTYTASRDAALALVEQVGFRLWTIDASVRGRYSVMLASLEKRPLTDEDGRAYSGTEYVMERHSDLPIAICRAALSTSKQGAEPSVSPQGTADEVSSRGEQ